MSEHKYPCTAEPPDLIYPQVANASTTHLHECIHDATDHQRLVEHECSCGMTWRARELALLVSAARDEGEIGRGAGRAGTRSHSIQGTATTSDAIPSVHD